MRGISILLIPLVLAGCENGKLKLGNWFAGGGDGRPEQSSPAGAPGAKQQPGPQADGSPRAQAVAYVNGEPISRDDLYDLMVLAEGAKTARHLVACRVVEQAATQRGVAVSEEEIQAEHDLTLGGMFPDVTDQAHRERMLDDLMARGNVSRKQWRMSMRRQALLCKMAGQDVTVSDQEMQEAFEEEFGRKVVVRHIQSASLEESQQAMERLKAGEDFAALARQVSKNSSAEDGGLLPAIGARPASVPAALQKAAWAMTSPGETAGPIQVGTSYHILRLERIVEPRKADLAEVKDQLAPQVKYRKLRDAKGRLLRELIDQAQVRWVDPALAGGGNAGVEPGGMGEP